jgi:hypothetical protein
MSASSTLPLFHVVGFSGHRQLKNADAISRAVKDALEMLRKESNGELVALSSVATGGDQLFVAQATELGMSWYAILPMPRTEFSSDFTETEWREVERTLERAEHVRVITENGSRDDAYLDCGIETVNGSDVLIAVWDGDPVRGKGGTADVVAYSKSIGKPVLIIDAVTYEMRRENWTAFQRGDSSLENLNRLPDVPGVVGGNPFKAPDAIFNFQRKCDFAASRNAPRFRMLIASTVILHVAATLIAAAALAYGLNYIAVPWAKLTCLAAALGVAVVLRRHAHSHESWVRCRLAAEFCRSALATWGLPRAIPLFQELDLPNGRGLTRTLLILHSRASAAQPVPMAEFKKIYLEQRIDDQVSYYLRQEGHALPLFSRLKLGFWIATILALICTAAYAVGFTLNLEVPEWIRSTVFHFLPIALPVVAASLISLISINDLQRRVARYREMRFMLEGSRKQIAFCETWNSLERLVLKTERALLQEVLEWHSITSFSESH